MTGWKIDLERAFCAHPKGLLCYISELGREDKFAIVGPYATNFKLESPESVLTICAELDVKLNRLYAPKISVWGTSTQLGLSDKSVVVLGLTTGFLTSPTFKEQMKNSAGDFDIAIA